MDTEPHNHESKHSQSPTEGEGLLHVLCTYYIMKIPQLCEMSTIITILDSQKRKASHRDLKNNVLRLTPQATNPRVCLQSPFCTSTPHCHLVCARCC